MTTFTQRTVNENGIAQIAAFLVKFHKNGEMLSEVKTSLNAYADDVEFSLGEGNDAMFEISASHSVSGCPVVCTLSEQGLASKEVEIDE